MSYENEKKELFEKYNKLSDKVLDDIDKKGCVRDGEGSVELRRLTSELQHKHYELRKKYGLPVE